MDEQEAELRNPFPSPPSHYTNYTTHNLALLALLNERTDPTSSESQSQQQVLSDCTDVPDWSLRQLEKPRVDWILEDGHYNVFGDTWFVKETIPSLADSGGHQLYPADPSVDRRPALLNVLHSLLVTYSSLTSSLLLSPPTASSTHEPEWQRHVEWINVLAQNIMAAANDLRPVQARSNLEMMMRRQLELRREETNTLHQKCDALEAKLADLRVYASPRAALTNTLEHDSEVPSDLAPQQTQDEVESPTKQKVTAEDVLGWAEEV